MATSGDGKPTRVDIRYDPGTGDPEVRLPFVMGVMADLSGDSQEELPDLGDRKFQDINADNFDNVMKSAKPSVKCAVPNTLTGEGNLNVDISFEKMEDFSPAAVARKVEPMRQVLELREQLEELKGKLSGETEQLLDDLLNNPAFQQKEE